MKKHLSPNESFQYAQRLGFLEGRKRVGQYVIGECLVAATEATEAQLMVEHTLPSADAVHPVSFEWGFADGYILGATGDTLDEE